MEGRETCRVGPGLGQRRSTLPMHRGGFSCPGWARPRRAGASVPGVVPTVSTRGSCSALSGSTGGDARGCGPCHEPGFRSPPAPSLVAHGPWACGCVARAHVCCGLWWVMGDFIKLHVRLFGESHQTNLKDLMTNVGDRHGHPTSLWRCDCQLFVSGDPQIWVLPKRSRAVLGERAGRGRVQTLPEQPCANGSRWGASLRRGVVPRRPLNVSPRSCLCWPVRRGCLAPGDTDLSPSCHLPVCVTVKTCML